MSMINHRCLTEHTHTHISFHRTCPTKWALVAGKAVCPELSRSKFTFNRRPVPTKHRKSCGGGGELLNICQETSCFKGNFPGLSGYK